jgi:hypothetical protein
MFAQKSSKTKKDNALKIKLDVINRTLIFFHF